MLLLSKVISGCLEIARCGTVYHTHLRVYTKYFCALSAGCFVPLKPWSNT